MKKSFIILALVALTFSSCGLYTKYKRPVDINTMGLYGNAESGDSVSLGTTPWKEFFTDPTLQALIEKGLKQNATAKEIDLRILEVEAYLKVAKLAFIPAMGFSPTGSLSAWDWGETKKGYSLPVSASWQIGSIGYLRNNKWKADVSVEQAKVAQQAVQQSLVATIANLYYTLCMLDDELVISKQTVKNWHELIEKTKNLFAAGQSNKAALAQYQANCFAIEAQVLDLEHAITETQNVLCSLLGEAPHPIQRTSLGTFVIPSVIETGVPMLMLANRPDVKQAELNLASAYYDVNIARSQFYPSLNITGTLGFTNQAGQTIINPGSFIWSAVAGLVQPIFQNGRIVAQYKVAKHEQEIALIDFQQALIDAGSEVNTALAKLQTNQGKKVFLAGQVSSLEEAVYATERLFENTANTNYLNILTARTSLLSAQLSAIANECATVQATIELYQALGGGSLIEKPVEEEKK